MNILTAHEAAQLVLASLAAIYAARGVERFTRGRGFPRDAHTKIGLAVWFTLLVLLTL